MAAEPEVKIFTAPPAVRYNAMNVFLVHVSLEFHRGGRHMALVTMNRAQLLRKLNQRFSEGEIKRTATLFRSMPRDAALARLGEVLGIIPKNEIKLWQESTQRVPVLIAGALMGGILDHLRTVGRTRGTKFAGPKALHFNIVDRNAFGLQISQKPTRTDITVMMRNRPFTGKRSAGKSRR
jgi:hypothetical protein